MRFLGIAALASGVVLAFAAPAGANVAPCDKAILGSGPPDWEQEALRAGPVGVFEDPLAHMSRTGNGLVTKMPLLVEGHDPVTVSVPPGLRRRVSLYYGNVLDRQGQPTTSFYEASGYKETRFEPCAGRPRTPWPGGIRVKGRAPIHLTVRTETGALFQLRLGRPHPHTP
jgi:hypothetical protein